MLDIQLIKSQQLKTFLILSCLFLVSSCSSSPTLSLDDSAGATSSTSTTSTESVNTTESTSLEDDELQDGELDYEQSVRQQFQELVQWQDTCYQQPKSCRVDEFTIVGTKYHQALSEQISLYAKSNINSRPGHGKREVAIESITVDDAALVAQVDACIYDTVILYMDGFIFNDHVSSSHNRWTLQLDNNRWKWINFQILHREYNTNICQE
ncbi:MAG: hypothetical protein F2583_07005 [Actinobacteria bacterium]|uniref:Unannotated protein n=1 Tax=freshwater metagenome TaxID=449393 RepID=A0A6J6HJ94_9ZZZZ|nr:hypothetical protein [Actinomycetota bacterium]